MHYERSTLHLQKAANPTNYFMSCVHSLSFLFGLYYRFLFFSIVDFILEYAKAILSIFGSASIVPSLLCMISVELIIASFYAQ